MRPVRSGRPDALLARGVRHVVVTLGSEGALVKGAEMRERVAARRVEAVDTTGAGDTFNGCAGRGAFRRASALGGGAFRHGGFGDRRHAHGAQSAVPMREEVDALLAEV